VLLPLATAAREQHVTRPVTPCKPTGIVDGEQRGGVTLMRRIAHASHTTPAGMP